MRIELTGAIVSRALQEIKPWLEKYQRIQSALAAQSNFEDVAFRRQFNGFYRVRGGQDWQTQFYSLFPRIRNNELSFSDVLQTFYERTGRVEASFSSKAVATFNPNLPVIDSKVLEFIGQKLPARNEPFRLKLIVDLHKRMAESFGDFLSSEAGAVAVRQFDREYPESGITEMKKLDLILWKAIRA